MKIEDYLSVKEPEKYKGISKKFYMEGPDGLEADILTYAALISNLYVPDSKGEKADVMLGLKDLDAYMNSGANHGSVVGRSANRISGGAFTIDGVTYKIPQNDGPNNLHTGRPAYQNIFWEGEVMSSSAADSMISNSGIAGIGDVYGEAVLLRCVCKDGECGFPGNITTEVLYAWLEDATLLILYKAKSDKATVFAPTNHSYFNLSGHGTGSVENHIMMIDSDTVTVKDEFNCPNGRYMSVEGTDFDFRTPDFLDKVLNENEPQSKGCRGIDQNYCLKTQDGAFSCVGYLTDPESRRTMEVYTDLPGIQIYAGNHVGHDGDEKDGKEYCQYGGVCLEAQMYPNAVNIPEFKSPVIKAGETVYHSCGYKFIAD